MRTHLPWILDSVHFCPHISEIITLVYYLSVYYFTILHFMLPLNIVFTCIVYILQCMLDTRVHTKTTRQGITIMFTVDFYLVCVELFIRRVASTSIITSYVEIVHQQLCGNLCLKHSIYTVVNVCNHHRQLHIHLLASSSHPT